LREAPRNRARLVTKQAKRPFCGQFVKGDAMAELVTAARMRAIEAAAIASGRVTGLELMERAGQGVVAAVLAEWPEMALTAHCALVLCGPGNNGGDGFVVARLLKARGWTVEVFLHGDPGRMPPDAKANHDRWRAMGAVRALPVPDTPHDPWGSDLIVDALFGTGLTRRLDPEAGLARMLPEWDLRAEPGRPRVVAVDAPSGLCADSGRAIGGCALWADLTVTFHRAKAGHFLAEGPAHCGRLVLADIGLGERSGDRVGPTGTALRRTDIPADTGVLGKADPFGLGLHKYSHGHALVLSGPATRTGAARLAARGALRVGAGVVTVGAEAAAMAEHAARLDAVMLRAVADGAALAGVLEDRRINAICVGPGLGLDARAAGMVAAALGGPPSPSLPHEGGGRRVVPGAAPGEKAAPSPLVGRGGGWGAADARRAVVLDADALTLLSRDPSLFALLHDRCILTPHAGEFARLFPDIAAELEAPPTRGPAFSKVDATRAASVRAGCVVLFKGADTVIAAPDGRCSINSAHYDRAAPWLATAGSGDVLAGFITGLLARGLAPMQAAETAAWLHVDCARAFGPGLIAEDLPETLPRVFRDLCL
jgi:hydroxyethylthiazole kinase-like uncharacterized protein yjeF